MYQNLLISKNNVNVFKADREYAIALNSFVLQSQKFDAQIQCGSYVAKSWSIFVEETEKMSKTVKESADNLANGILEKLNSLYVEKKSNRKQHQEEYGRNQAELNRLQESVHRLRNDYERCTENMFSYALEHRICLILKYHLNLT